MFVQPEDKAHNLGNEKEAIIAMTGASIVALKETEPTAVEYEKITMAIPPQGKDSRGIKFNCTITTGALVFL